MPLLYLKYVEGKSDVEGNNDDEGKGDVEGNNDDEGKGDVEGKNDIEGKRDVEGKSCVKVRVMLMVRVMLKIRVMMKVRVMMMKGKVILKVRVMLMIRCGSHPIRRTDHMMSAGKGVVLTHQLPARTLLYILECGLPLHGLYESQTLQGEGGKGREGERIVTGKEIKVVIMLN